jgi:hypothetical protein
MCAYLKTKLMKKLFTLLALIATIAIKAQAPQGFNYQATVRNSSGQLLVNQIVLVKFKILKNSATGDIVYSETQTANTDDLGQINLVVGQGTAPTGTFSTINWDSGSYYLGIELNSGSGYVEMGTTQLLSVPYALYAEKSGSSATPATNGLNALIKTTVESAGANCTSGGTKLEVGLDADKNGVLDDNEVNATQTKYVCNGAQGIAGPQGIQGPVSNSIGANAAFSSAISTYNENYFLGWVSQIAVSNNGKYIIAGNFVYNDNTQMSNLGKVKVIRYENGTFENVGQEFIGTSQNNGFGMQVGISEDGQTIFFVGNTPNDGYIYKLVNNTWVLHSTIPNIGFVKAKMNATADLIVSLDNSGNTTQSITFYKLVGTNWVSSQFFADGILGNSDLQISNDGSIVALSNYNQNLGVIPNTWDVANGRTGVFYYNGSTFTQKGNFIEGPNTKGWGYSICLSDDGTKVGITTNANSVTQDTTDPCYIRTYQYNATTNLWSQYNNEVVFRSENQQGAINFLDFDSSSNYLFVVHKINWPNKPYYLLMKNINNNWNQYGTTIEFTPVNLAYFPDNFEFKSNIFFHIIDGKLRIKDFN